MTMLRKSILLLALMMLVGAARLPYEQALTEELREAGLKREQLDISTRDMIDQTSTAAALGGMRTLVATFYNFEASLRFQQQRWDELELTYRTIADLAPRTSHYWETGSWHLAYNAASYYLYDSSLPSMRRRELWRSFILRGRDFLELGIRNNPENWKLHAARARLLADSNKLMAFQDRDASLLEAVNSYARAIELGSPQAMLFARLQFYALARVPGHEEEALQMARSLYADLRHRTPTVLALLYILEYHVDPERDAESLALDIFEDAETAYEVLKRQWQRNREGYPIDGVAVGLAQMERLLGVPSPQSVLAHPPPSSPSMENWFEQD